MGASGIVRLTDKWSKRSFSVRLAEKEMPQCIGDIVALLARTTERDLQRWLHRNMITADGIEDFHTMQQALFHINDDGTRGERIEEVALTHEGLPLQVTATVPCELFTAPTGETCCLADLTLDRDNLAYNRNWQGYYRRNWQAKHAQLVTQWIKRDYSVRPEELLATGKVSDVERFIRTVAEHVAAAPYELYSRYLGRSVPFKTVAETLFHIGEGRGGNCSEKAAVIDFICANYGITAHICLSGHDAKGTFPDFHLRRALERSSTIFTGENQRYWEHFANCIVVDGERWLLDATGGPMPFLFAQGEEAASYFSQERYLPVKFIAREERFYYHDAPIDITYGALFNMEVFLPDVDIYHIFGPEGEDEPFGLAITPDLWICPNAYKTDSAFAEHCQAWKAYAGSAERIEQLEVYRDLSAAAEKTVLSQVEQQYPALINDLRKIEQRFEQRCRYIWRDEQWRIGYVFCLLRRADRNG